MTRQARILRFGAPLILSAAMMLPALAEPALFVARDQDSSVYVYGTVHSLRPQMGARSWVHIRHHAHLLD